jgi:inosine/xanthosine triphosphate pyrophosphatase family protein
VRFMLATGNRHKLGEFRQILTPCDVLLMPEGVELPPEGVESFAANARGKALGLAEAVRAMGPAAAGADDGLNYLADDSGLEVEAPPTSSACCARWPASPARSRAAPASCAPLSPSRAT